MPTLDLVLRAERVVTPHGEVPAAIGIADGRIAVLDQIDSGLTACAEVQVPSHHVVLPGLVDTHVHLQDPGTDWEGFDSGTRAAALGGVTTVVDMPLDCQPVTTDLAAFEAKTAAAAGRIHVDVGMWGGAVPANLGGLGELASAGVLGFKCFLSDSGTEGFPPLSYAELVIALHAVRALDTVLLVHAEDAAALSASPRPVDASYAAWLDTRPVSIETTAVSRVIDAVAATDGRAHVVHVSTAEAADLIADARAAGLPVTGETAPHYLTLAAEDVPARDTSWVVSPPLRERATADQLWRQLRTGGLGMVVSDHSPCGDELKATDTGDFAAAFGGISSLQLSLPVVWTEARRRGHTLVDVARWMSTEPARLAGLGRKGAIAVGRDADLCVLDPDASFTVAPETLAHRQHASPYSGRSLVGMVVQTWLAGQLVDVDIPRGRLLRRGGAEHRVSSVA
jgi:allantoinase